MISQKNSVVLSAQIHTLNTEYYFLSLLCMHTCKHMRIKTAHSAKMQKNLFFFALICGKSSPVCETKQYFKVLFFQSQLSHYPKNILALGDCFQL